MFLSFHDTHARSRGEHSLNLEPTKQPPPPYPHGWRQAPAAHGHVHACKRAVAQAHREFDSGEKRFGHAASLHPTRGMGMPDMVWTSLAAAVGGIEGRLARRRMPPALVRRASRALGRHFRRLSCYVASHETRSPGRARSTRRTPRSLSFHAATATLFASCRSWLLLCLAIEDERTKTLLTVRSVCIPFAATNRLRSEHSTD
ncbi:MAG: hypothetical protein JWN04_5929 [Myxococcaceae bacterium]|nr:hypothetical protein [Myxococcaceae bacterium]